MVEASDHDALQLHNIFTHGAEKEIFGLLDWCFDTSIMLQEVLIERPCPLRPGTLVSWNAIADGEDTFVYLQIWRQSDATLRQQQAWARTHSNDYQVGRGTPLPPLMSSIKALIELAQRKNLIRYGEEAPIATREKENIERGNIPVGAQLHKRHGSGSTPPIRSESPCFSEKWNDTDRM